METDFLLQLSDSEGFPSTLATPTREMPVGTAPLALMPNTRGPLYNCDSFEDFQLNYV